MLYDCVGGLWMLCRTISDTRSIFSFSFLACYCPRARNHYPSVRRILSHGIRLYLFSPHTTFFLMTTPLTTSGYRTRLEALQMFL